MKFCYRNFKIKIGLINIYSFKNSKKDINVLFFKKFEFFGLRKSN
jgi:hypothetical protein